MVETALQNLLAADAPPQDDRLFTLAVMARIERRDFHRALVTKAVLALAAALVLAPVMPVLENVWRVNFAPVASNLVIGLTLMLLSALVAYPVSYKD